MEYNNSTNIHLIVNALKENNIRHIVISPGGTNIVFAKAVQDDSFFKCYSVVDERSAMYFAIGIYLETGEIVATSCTSAQATRNYIPGLTEAFYKKAPILAITMEKHPRFKYQNYMQAPDQTSLPNDAVKKSFELPYIGNLDEYIYSIRKINEAILELTLGEKGPVQLCVPFLDWPVNGDTPKRRFIKRYTLFDSWDDVALMEKKIMVAIGEHRPFLNEETQAIEDFCESTNAIVYANNLSNYNGKWKINGMTTLMTTKLDTIVSEYAPDILITFGGLTGDYPFFNTFQSNLLNDTEHWLINTDGRVIDTYDKLTKVFQCREVDFFQKLTDGNSSDHSYYNKWLSLKNEKDIMLDVPFSNIYTAQKLYNRLPANSNLHLAILNSLRTWLMFDLDKSIKVFSNVGAFGIDGCMSTMIGQSVVTDAVCFMIVGDLSFYYDMNSLGIKHIKNNVRVLLVNNGGGVEFKMSAMNNKSIDRYIAAGGHFKTAKGWAEDCGFTYLSASDKDSFDSQIDSFVGYSDKPVLFEVFVDDIDDATANRRIREGNTNYNVLDKLEVNAKNSIRRFFKK